VRVSSSRWAVRATTTLCAAAAAFVALTLGAMALYPGGSYSDPHSAGYRFFGNFFSDLGQTYVMYGHVDRPNTPSCVLFVLAMGGISASLAWAAWPIGRVVSGGRSVGSVLIGGFGTVAAFGFLGVAVNPWNLRYSLHMLFVKIAFGALFAFMAGVAIEQVRHRWRIRDVIAGAAYAVALCAYFINLQVAKLDSVRAVMTQSVLQKVIVYLSVLCLSLIAWAVRSRALDDERVSS
jgi:hypothetical protein